MTTTGTAPRGVDLMELELRDPRTGNVRRTVKEASQIEIDDLVRCARLAAPAWSKHPPAERARRLMDLAAGIEGSIDEFVAAEVAGTGKPAAEARQEAETSADIFRFFAGSVRAAMAPAAGQLLRNHESWVRWEPLGVIAAIVPWNYPLLMAAWRCAPALAAGNAVILKPAETTPDSAELLCQIAAEALGTNILTCAVGGRNTGRLLVEGQIDGIAFTGSERGGRSVAAAAGIRPASLELGGNCPAVVFPDAPDRTFEALVRAVTYNAGQSCAAPARVITLTASVEWVIEGLSHAIGQATAGIDFGPLNNPDQLQRFDQIMDGAAARVTHCGPVAVCPDEKGGYWRPATVLAALPADAPAVQEEIFGPVLTVQHAPTVPEIIAMANSVPQALASSVWSECLDGALAAARDMDAGEVWVNCHLAQTPELPHGGRGASGSGTDLSILALDEFRRPKTVTVAVAADGEDAPEGSRSWR